MTLSEITEPNLIIEPTVSHREFFATIHKNTPNSNYYLNIWVKQTKKSYYLPLHDGVAITTVIDSEKVNNDVYFSVGLGAEAKEQHQRSAENDIVCSTVLFLDIDFTEHKDNGKNYPLKAEALPIIDAFEVKPAIITSTGNGLHCFVLLDAPVIMNNDDDRKAFKAISVGYQRYVQEQFRKNGFEIDSVPDLSRNARIPCTLNHKKVIAKPVSLLQYHPDLRYNVDAVKVAVADFIPKTSPRKHASNKASQFPEADHNKIMEGCGWYRERVVAGAATCDESNWYAAASITGLCENGSETFRSYSTKHPDYTEKEADYKLKRAISEAGPRTCESIRLDLGNEKYCADCPHYGKITSPVQLG